MRNGSFWAWGGLALAGLSLSLSLLGGGCGAGDKTLFDDHFGAGIQPINFLAEPATAEGFVFVPGATVPPAEQGLVIRPLKPGDSPPTPPEGFTPARGATVRLLGVGQVATDENGHYVLPSVPPGPHVMEVVPPPETGLKPVQITVNIQ